MKNKKRSTFSKKRLADRIADVALQEPYIGKANRNLASFLANREEIQEAIALGWSLRSIWKILNQEEKFPSTYESFLAYVKKYIQGGSVDDATKEDLPMEKNLSLPPKAKTNGLHHFVQSTEIENEKLY